MVLGALSSIGISLEKDASRLTTRAGYKPIGWPAGAQTGSLIYRLPENPTERASLFAKEQRILVSEGEIAVVIKDGSLVGSMDPGTYRTEKQRVLGNVDVIWMKTGPRLIRWGVGNVMSRDGIQVGANGTLSVRISDGARFNAEVVQGQLTLPDTELQRLLMPGVQGILRSMLGSTEALALMTERDAFIESISKGLGESLDGLGLALGAFEVSEFNLPAEFKDAVASATLASARGKGEVVQAEVEMQKRVLEAQGEAAAMLMAGDARAKVFAQLRAAGIDPMSVEAMDALKKYAETPSAGGLVGADTAKAGLIASITTAAIRANQVAHEAAHEATPAAPAPPDLTGTLGIEARASGAGSLDAPPPAPPESGEASDEASGGASGEAAGGAAGGASLASLTSQLDKLTERLADGEISEALYMKLSERLEQRIAALGESRAGDA